MTDEWSEWLLHRRHADDPEYQRVLSAETERYADRVLAGALAGLLISLPDAFALDSYVGVLGTGIVFGAIAGWAGNKWTRRRD